MQVSVRIDCTPTEARRLLGQPDLLPLYETLATAAEDWLMALLAALDPGVLETPTAARAGRPRPAAAAGKE
jgi:hypothetical protein